MLPGAQLAEKAEKRRKRLQEAVKVEQDLALVQLQQQVAIASLPCSLAPSLPPLSCFLPCRQDVRRRLADSVLECVCLCARAYVVDGGRLGVVANVYKAAWCEGVGGCFGSMSLVCLSLSVSLVCLPLSSVCLYQFC